MRLCNGSCGIKQQQQQQHDDNKNNSNRTTIIETTKNNNKNNDRDNNNNKYNNTDINSSKSNSHETTATKRSGVSCVSLHDPILVSCTRDKGIYVMKNGGLPCIIGRGTTCGCRSRNMKKLAVRSRIINIKRRITVNLNILFLLQYPKPHHPSPSIPPLYSLPYPSLSPLSLSLLPIA